MHHLDEVRDPDERRAAPGTELQDAREYLDTVRAPGDLDEAWNSLPPDVQRALDAAGDGYVARYDALRRDSVHRALAAFEG
jgi:hypothetical protein